LEGDYFIIYGTKCRDLLYGDLYDAIMLFREGRIGWNYLEKLITRDRDKTYSNRIKDVWIDLDDGIKERTIDINSIYIDGVKAELN